MAVENCLPQEKAITDEDWPDTERLMMPKKQRNKTSLDTFITLKHRQENNNDPDYGWGGNSDIEMGTVVTSIQTPIAEHTKKY